MTISSGRIILFKQESSPNDRFRKALEESLSNFRVDFLPVLSFEPTWNNAFLDLLMKDLQECYGIILTSPRAGQELVKILSSFPTEVISQLKALRKIYVVGKGTMSTVQVSSMPPCNILYNETVQNADSLCDFILAEGDESENVNVEKRKLLFLCGRKRRKTIVERLGGGEEEGSSSSRFQVVERVVYDAVPVSELLVQWQALNLHRNHPVYLVFFSTNGFKLYHEQIYSQAPEPTKLQFVYLAIGSVTASTIREMIINPSVKVYCCEMATPESLVECIFNCREEDLSTPGKSD